MRTFLFVWLPGGLLASTLECMVDHYVYIALRGTCPVLVIEKIAPRRLSIFFSCRTMLVFIHPRAYASTLPIMRLLMKSISVYCQISIPLSTSGLSLSVLLFCKKTAT